MTQAQTDALSEIFREVFDDDSIIVRPELTAGDIDGWDSLAHVRLLYNIEQKFGIRFTSSELGVLESVGDLMNLIDKKMGPNALAN